MQIKASLTAHKNGFYVVFKPGMRVSLIQGEYGYEPRRPHMTAAQKREFASASAGITYDALIDALVPIKGGLIFYEFHTEDIISVLEAVMFHRSQVRGRAIEAMTDAQESKVRAMMGEESAPLGAPFSFDDTLRGMMER